MNEGIRIRLARVLEKKSQTALAKEIGVSQGLVSMMELNKIVPGEKLKEKIAESLNVKTDELFPGA